VNLSYLPITKALAKSEFNCGIQELNLYFRRYAVKNDKLSIGKTFVAVDDQKNVLGYITLSSAQITLDSLPQEAQAKLPKYPVPAFRIAKLAVSKDHQGKGLGARLLKEALTRAVSVSKEIAIHMVLVDAIDERAKTFLLEIWIHSPGVSAAHPLSSYQDHPNGLSRELINYKTIKP
jgi:GNAT superfamily N-acetyltransferase